MTEIHKKLQKMVVFDVPRLEGDTRRTLFTFKNELTTYASTLFFHMEFRIFIALYWFYIYINVSKMNDESHKMKISKNLLDLIENNELNLHHCFSYPASSLV